MSARGKFITLEGPEGSGKSTQCRTLVDRLETQGINVVLTREPGGTPTGEIIREILQHNKSGEPITPSTEVLLFEASRAQLVQTVIVPALEKGDWVICDRFADSTSAYQGFGRGFSLDEIFVLNDFAIKGAVPDLTLFFDVEVEEGFRRLSERLLEFDFKEDRIESEARSFHEKVRKGYIELLKKFPERIKRIDAAAEKEAVAKAVWHQVEQLLP